MTCPALARPCGHSTLLSCTSIPEARPKNPSAAGQDPPGPQAERGAAWQCPSHPRQLLKGLRRLGCISGRLTGESQRWSLARGLPGTLGSCLVSRPRCPGGQSQFLYPAEFLFPLTAPRLLPPLHPSPAGCCLPSRPWSLRRRTGHGPGPQGPQRSAPAAEDGVTARGALSVTVSLIPAALCTGTYLLLALVAKLCPPTSQPGTSVAPPPPPCTAWQLRQALPYLLDEEGDGRGGGCARVTAFTPPAR